jgi:hypothetical protein
LVVRAMVTATRASATERRETGARFGHFASNGVGAGVLVPGDHLLLDGLGVGQACTGG